MSERRERPRVYRFGTHHAAGWLLGLSGPQCIALATGLVCSSWLLNGHLPFLLSVVPSAAGCAFAFGSWRGERLHVVLPTRVGWLIARATGSTRWFARIPQFHWPSGRTSTDQPDLPPALQGLRILEANAESEELSSPAPAVVVDELERSITASFRVQGRQFALCERSEQERLLDLWGDAISAFCRERGLISRIRWIEWAAPSNLGQRQLALEPLNAGRLNQQAADSYASLLVQMAPQTVRRDVIVAITLDRQRTRSRSTSSTRHDGEAVGLLLNELGLLRTRLEVAGLEVGEPLGRAELSRCLRLRLDPFAFQHSLADPSRRRSLVELSSGISPPNSGPMSMEATLTHVRIDSAMHVAYVIAEWPRLDVQPDWMEPLLLQNGGIRTVAVLYEPMSPSKARREIDKQSVKLAADEEQRSRTGFRITARHRRIEADVLAREAELVGGFGEFEFAGFVIVTARDLDSLERSCSEYEQAAAQAGLELRRLDGRHDLALVLTLPIGRGVARRRSV